MDALEPSRAVAPADRDLLRFVAIGSVDDGKSTLIGRLLHDANAIYDDQLHAVARASQRSATPSCAIDFSLFTDGLIAEREQGITIDVAYRHFATEQRSFLIADTPGHVQYTRNMATGASTADAAVILIDARLGVQPQTRLHARISSLLGIRHIIACVNKMDLVDFRQDRFEEITRELAIAFDEMASDRSASRAEIYAIPTCALAGDNVVTKSTRTPWFVGEPLLARLSNVPLARPEGPFRMPIQLVLRPRLSPPRAPTSDDRRAFAGRIAGGIVEVGDEVSVLPSNQKTRVIAIDEAGRSVSRASAQSSVTLRFEDEIDVSRGDLVVRAPDAVPITASNSVAADVVWMGDEPLDDRRQYLVKHTTRVVRATLRAAEGRGVAMNDIARVHVDAQRPLLFDPYRLNRTMGSFIVIDPSTNDTVAAGMIVGARSGEDHRAPEAVSDDERWRRLGQRGVVVRVSAPTPVEATALARTIERALFEEGLLVTCTEEAAARPCAHAGIVAIVIGRRDQLAIEVESPRGDVLLTDLLPFEEDARDALVRCVRARPDASC